MYPFQVAHPSPKGIDQLLRECGTGANAPRNWRDFIGPDLLMWPFDRPRPAGPGRCGPRGGEQSWNSPGRPGHWSPAGSAGRGGEDPVEVVVEYRNGRLGLPSTHGVLCAEGASTVSEEDVEASLGTTRVYRCGPADPAAEWRTPVGLMRGRAAAPPSGAPTPLASVPSAPFMLSTLPAAPAGASGASPCGSRSVRPSGWTKPSPPAPLGSTVGPAGGAVRIRAVSATP